MEYKKWAEKEKKKKKKTFKKILKKMWNDFVGRVGILSLISSFMLLTYFFYLICTESSNYIGYVISGGLSFILMLVGFDLINTFFEDLKKLNSTQKVIASNSRENLFDNEISNLHLKKNYHIPLTYEVPPAWGDSKRLPYAFISETEYFKSDFDNEYKIGYKKH